MSSNHPSKVVITGIGMITPLGHNPSEVLRRIKAGDSAAAAPTGFDASGFACPVCAQVRDFEPHRFVSEAKMIRLMNRDAQLAVAAARLALEDAAVVSGKTYPPEEIALFGATGLAGLPVREVTPLIRVSAGPEGEFDLTRFGQAGLRAVSPILSFKILSNMPFCFVSINENIQGSNSVYTPWEGQGAQAVEAGVRALQAGDARCALVGGCDLKTHELAIASLQQQGLFDSWRTAPARAQPPGTPASLSAGSRKPGNAGGEADVRGRGVHGDDGVHGIVPGEGAAFLVLEAEQEALERGMRVYAYVNAFVLRPRCSGQGIAQVRADVLNRLNLREADTLVSSANGDEAWEEEERSILEAAGISVGSMVSPKKQVGDLFAAAALLQIALGAALTGGGATTVLANCFGHGSTQAAFVLEREDRHRRSRS